MYTIERIKDNWLEGTMSDIVAIYFLEDFGLTMEVAVGTVDKWKQEKEGKEKES